MPTAAELVAAVRGFLEDEVVGAADRALSFQGRVAANALAIVERELTAPDPPSAARALGLDDDAALAAALRSGALDDRLDDVRRALGPEVAARLRIANPRYLAEEDRP